MKYHLCIYRSSSSSSNSGSSDATNWTVNGRVFTPVSFSLSWMFRFIGSVTMEGYWGTVQKITWKQIVIGKQNSGISYEYRLLILLYLTFRIQKICKWRNIPTVKFESLQLHCERNYFMPINVHLSQSSINVTYFIFIIDIYILQICNQSAALFLFAKIGDFSAPGWNFRKMCMYTLWNAPSGN